MPHTPAWPHVLGLGATPNRIRVCLSYWVLVSESGFSRLSSQTLKIDFELHFRGEASGWIDMAGAMIFCFDFFQIDRKNVRNQGTLFLQVELHPFLGL